MTRSPLALAVVSTLLFVAPLALAADPIPKQLAGPAEDFAQMRVPDPAEAAIYSHSALLPVTMSVDADGKASWQGELPVEGNQVRFLVFSGNNANWQLQLTSPSGQRLAGDVLAAGARATDFGIEAARVPTNYYTLEGIDRGSWNIRIDGSGSRSRNGFLLVEGNEATELLSYQTHRRQIVGEQLDLVATLGDTRRAGNTSGRIASAELRVTAPDGSVRTYPMYDDGRHNDAQAGDGVYGGGFRAERAGDYQAQVIARGQSAEGDSIVRTAEHVMSVVEPSLRLSNLEALVGTTVHPDGRLTIDLPVTTTRQNQHYRAYAELWGTDDKGQPIAVSWVGGMVTPQDGKLGIGFDPRWVARVKARAPFQLRSLRLEDPDHFVTLASADVLGLDLAARAIVAEAPAEIDEAMRMGPRPVVDRTAEGVGKRLILVHGYCSGGVWPAAQFSTASSFLDVNQNRSHDQFARLLQSYGATWNSFGTVAHSQGGAASLHLYHYYWSGLDNATGARLIQSVGTPYKGTNLAGILATLGSWFGVGCGTNDNLSYSGASAWLAGIPNSSRAKVNYYTTAFRTTNWWTNDYCQIATDLVLSDPEDGTTEQTNGQLSGGVNRGHTTGQCHTAGMRDPAQYLDSSRNATMNTNAAR